MASFVSRFIFWAGNSVAAVFGGVNPSPPRNLRLKSVTAANAGQVDITWEWQPATYYGRGATQIRYQTQRQETDSNGNVALSWRAGDSPATGQFTEKTENVPGDPQGVDHWQLRVRTINNANPNARSAWVTSSYVSATTHAPNAAGLYLDGQPLLLDNRRLVVQGS